MNLGFEILFGVFAFIFALVSAATSHWQCRIGAVTSNVSCHSNVMLLHRREPQAKHDRKT